MKPAFGRTILSFLTLVAFVASVMMPFAAAYAMGTAASQGQDTRVLICTSTGYKWVEAQGLVTGGNVSDQSDTSSRNSVYKGLGCAICDQASSAGVMLPQLDVVVVGALVLKARQEAMSPYVLGAISALFYDAPARAPPV